MQKIAIALLFLLQLSLIGFSQCPQSIDEWVLWEDNNCRIFVKELKGKKPVLFISELGIDFTYLAKNCQFRGNTYKPVFFDQPGVTHSMCYDNSQINPDSIARFIKKIKDELSHKLSIVCHGSGCALGLKYLNKHVGSVNSIHLLKPNITSNQSGHLYFEVSKNEKANYEINQYDGAAYYPEIKDQLISSFSDKIKIPSQNNGQIHVYVDHEKLDKHKKASSIRFIGITSEDRSQVEVFKNNSFWRKLESNLKVDE